MSVIKVPTHLTLQTYMAQLQQVIKQNFGTPQWVIAELSEFNIRANGHCYLSLIESVDGKEVAKCNATMFANVANLQLQAFRSITGCDPAIGMKVLLNVSASLHPQYGFQLQVHTLDGNYTLGEMHARVEQIVQRLKSEGYYDRQRQHPIPTGYWRIAVVSPTQAAGLGDFRRDADRLHFHRLVEFTYYDAVFQGATASESIKHALRQVFDDHEKTPFDAVCLIRGGGAKADLAWLNDYGLAVWICRIPIPVYTGIGHERDETVLDLVAHTRFDTPSKVIGAVMRHLHQEANELQQVIDRGQSIVTNMVADEEASLQQAGTTYRYLVRDMFKGAVNDFKTDKQNFESGIAKLIHEQAVFLQSARANSQLLSQDILNQANEQLMKLWHEAQNQMHILVQDQIANYKNDYHAYRRLVPAMLIKQETFLSQANTQMFTQASKLVSDKQNDLITDRTKATHLFLSRIQAEETKLNMHRQQYSSTVLGLVKDEENQLKNWGSLFTALDPRSVMAKGFALVKSSGGHVLTSASSVTAGDGLIVQFHDGSVSVTAGESVEGLDQNPLIAKTGN
ncbi:exodeoxyribonuclease VII large subunit [Pseudomonas capsici]|uniref:exodeoxyribonuclease VII large subunit n=1 Tax=Pseudomonas capsici TaxID=2810614 RepID=UPI0021F0DB94|nr:exodeoxyribonuclease VII large subunit [Pseudomonas capsici]MCV4286474.1 exodeoxyribonuclease VII large subunit [Pseudomonas capsici]